MGDLRELREQLREQSRESAKWTYAYFICRLLENRNVYPKQIAQELNVDEKELKRTVFDTHADLDKLISVFKEQDKDWHSLGDLDFPPLEVLAKVGYTCTSEQEVMRSKPSQNGWEIRSMLRNWEKDNITLRIRTKENRLSDRDQWTHIVTTSFEIYSTYEQKEKFKEEVNKKCW